MMKIGEQDIKYDEDRKTGQKLTMMMIEEMGRR